MFKAIKRWWKYMGAKLNRSLDERADPKVQLEQAIQESHEQHKALTQQAANVIANQKQTEMRLDRAMGEMEKVANNARQAVMMADQASKAGDAAKAAEYTNTAESFANRLIALENEVEDLKQLSLQATGAADQAKAAVKKNSMALQKKLSERQALLGKIDQANMQAQMNTAMAQLSATIGDDVPTLEEVRDKVEQRYAAAKGMAELQGDSIEGRMLEVEQAAMNVEAQSRLAEIKAQLGIESADAKAPAPAELGQAETETEPQVPQSQPTADGQ